MKKSIPIQKVVRPMGEITRDLERLLEELTDEDQHDLQWGEALALVHNWLVVHAPHQQEEYMDGTHPIYYYGMKKGKK